MAEMHVFSTADLIANIVLPYKPVALRGAIGSPPATALAVQNIVDGNTATQADITSSDVNDTGFVVLDYGVSISFTSLTLLNVSVTPGSGVTGAVIVVVSDMLSTTSIPSGASSTGMTSSPPEPSTISSANLTFVPMGGLAAARGRYVYISGAGFSAMTIGDVGPTFANHKFGMMQNLTITSAWQRHDLFDAAQNASVAVDCADHEGRHEISCESAEFSASRLQLLAAAQIHQAAGSTPATVAALMGGYQLPFFTTRISLATPNGKSIAITAGRCKADGVKLPAKLTDFSVPSFKVNCSPDASGTVAAYTF